MDFLKKAKELGKRASDETARAVSATMAAGSKLKDGIAEKMGADLTAGGFGTMAKKALDKSTEVMLSSSVSLFNSVVRRLAEEPKYYLVTNERQLLEIRRQVDSTGNDWSTYSDANLVRLRAVFSNAWSTLDIGSEINTHLANKLTTRIDEVVLLLKSGEEGEMIKDPQAVAVMEAMQADGKVIEQFEDAELSKLITSVLNADQHYFSQVYSGLALAHGGDAEKAAEILGKVEDRPHYLVHLHLARVRASSNPESAARNIEVARQCRPSDAHLYKPQYGNEASQPVFDECLSVIQGG